MAGCCCWGFGVGEWAKVYCCCCWGWRVDLIGDPASGEDDTVFRIPSAHNLSPPRFTSNAP